MENTFSIITSLETYKDTATSELGTIYVKFNDEPFPNDEWTDFGFTIIPWWTQEVKKLTDRSETIVSCEFIDGSYRFDIAQVNSRTWKLSFIKEYADSEKIIFSGEVKPKLVLDSLLSTTNLMLQHIKASKSEKLNYWTERQLWLQQVTRSSS